MTFQESVYHCYENTRYYLVKEGKEWGLLVSIKNDLVTVKFEHGETQFSLQEIKTWVDERIIAPICGICNEPIFLGRLDAHLQTHKINIRG